MRLNATQREAVKEESRHVLVVACPGSGKTRTVVARVLRAIEHVRGTPRRLACITYTNAAAHEIDGRLRSLLSAEDAEYCDLGTIHSFCLQAVLRHHHRLIPGYRDGLAVAAPESRDFVTLGEQAIAETMRGRGARAQEFENVRRGTGGEPLIPGDTALTDDSVRRFWELLATRQLVDFPSMTYLTYRLFKEHLHLARSVASRYREILIDEMQDTDALQVEMFKCVAETGRTRFFLVGDHLQSIQGFAGAEPQRMFEFAESLNAKSEYSLHENWRSSQAIVSVAEALCPREPAMVAVGDTASFARRAIIIEAFSAVEAVVNGFLPLLESENIPVTNCAVLAPAWYLLFPIARELRARGVPVSGPGARPYKRARVFTGLIEYLCAYVANPAAELLHRVLAQVFYTVQQADGTSRFDIWERDGRLAVMEMVEEARQLRATNSSAIPWISAAADRLTAILRNYQFIGPRAVMVIRESAADIIMDMKRNREFDSDALTVDDIGDFANPEGSLRLLTMHSAKGREFDAVCIVELHEGLLPHPRGDINEARRVLYVGLTRPRKVLALCHRPGRPVSRFLSEGKFRGALG